MTYITVLFSFSLKAIIFELIFFNVSYTYATHDLEKNISVIDNHFVSPEINKSLENIPTNNEQQSIIQDTHSPNKLDMKNSSESIHPATYLRGYATELNKDKNNFTILTDNISELVSLAVQNIKSSESSSLDSETATFYNNTNECSLQTVTSGAITKSYSKKACDLNSLSNMTVQNETVHSNNYSNILNVEKHQSIPKPEIVPFIDSPQKFDFTPVDRHQDKLENIQQLLNDTVPVHDVTETVLSLTNNIPQPPNNDISTETINSSLLSDSDEFSDVQLENTNEQFLQQLSKFLKQSDDSLKRMKILPEPSFRSIGRDIPEKECYALCVLDNQCLSYRWTSYDNHCEFVYPSKKSCSEISSSIEEKQNCLMNRAIEEKSAKLSLKELTIPPLNEQKFPEFSKENNGMLYGSGNANIPRKAHGPILLPNYNEMSALRSHEEKSSPELTGYQHIDVEPKDSSQVRAASNHSLDPMDQLSNESLRHTKKEEQFASVLPRIPLLQNTLLGGGLTRLIPGVVPATLQSSLRIQEDIPTMMQGAANAIKTLQSVLAAGDTVMKTFPVADLIKATQTLSSNGFLKVGHAGGIKGGVPPGVKDKAKGATRPPRGVESPEVFCYPQGMRCCIPQGAASKYKKNPPMLNGIDTPECTAHYISNINKLCVTIMYEENRCNQAVIVTETSKVYRNVMIIPEKTMNNAICECILPKISENTTEKDQNYIIPASARWQYSRNAQEKELETKQRFHDTVKKLSNAAKTMFHVSDLVTKPYADTESRSMSEGAASFIETLSQLSDDLQQQTRTLSTVKKST